MMKNILWFIFKRYTSEIIGQYTNPIFLIKSIKLLFYIPLFTLSSKRLVNTAFKPLNHFGTFLLQVREMLCGFQAATVKTMNVFFPLLSLHL